MQNLKIGFIGCGNMGGALAKAASKTKKAEIFLADALTEKADALSKEIDANVCETKDIAQNCKYIFLGVKPQMMADLLKEIAPILKSRTDRFILVTMAAGIKTQKFNAMLKTEMPIIRIMPNTPVSVGEGMILYSPCKSVTASEQTEFCEILACAGRLDKLEEDLIDAACAISGCGPAFVYMFAESMAKAGEECGLPKEKAIGYAAQTLLGAAKLMLNSNKTPEVLRQEVCSPKGSTIEGVMSLQSSDFDNTVNNAVKASYNRTVELGK